MQIGIQSVLKGIEPCVARPARCRALCTPGPPPALPLLRHALQRRQALTQGVGHTQAVPGTPASVYRDPRARPPVVVFVLQPSAAAVV